MSIPLPRPLPRPRPRSRRPPRPPRPCEAKGRVRTIEEGSSRSASEYILLMKRTCQIPLQNNFAQCSHLPLSGCARISTLLSIFPPDDSNVAVPSMSGASQILTDKVRPSAFCPWYASTTASASFWFANRKRTVTLLGECPAGSGLISLWLRISPCCWKISYNRQHYYEHLH